MKARIRRFLLATALALAVALPVGALVQSRLPFDILSVETGAPKALDAAIFVVLSAMIAVLAAALVGLPIGVLARRLLRRDREVLVATATSSAVAVLLFTLPMPWSVPAAELALLLLLCASFYAAFFLVDRPRPVPD